METQIIRGTSKEIKGIWIEEENPKEVLSTEANRVTIEDRWEVVLRSRITMKTEAETLEETINMGNSSQEATETKDSVEGNSTDSKITK